ncbi:MAG: translation initiation factor IF-6 [Archaeoglobaceae archaeon]|nr:translation initiation factor IF-6 [Archaeoglobaceae archaeon]
MRLLAIRGNPLIGLYIKATEHAAIIGINEKNTIDAIKEELDVDVVVTTVAGSELVGALIAANSKGAVVSSLVTTKEIERISKYFDVKVIDTKMTCLGNNLCVNDKGGIAHPELDDETLNKIKDALDVEIVKGTIGGIKTVGMAAVITNKGGLLNPNVSEWELKKIKEVMGVEAITGTVNFGNDMVASSLVANTKGYIAGRDTTGFELGIIEEALFMG